MKGQGLIEYAMLLLLVVIILVAIVTIFGRTTGNLYNNVVISI